MNIYREDVIKFVGGRVTILVDQIRVEKEADTLETRDKSNKMKGNRNKFKMR